MQAEATGHILFIDNWVMHEACRQVKAWQTHVPGAAELVGVRQHLRQPAASPGAGELGRRSTASHPGCGRRISSSS